MHNDDITRLIDTINSAWIERYQGEPVIDVLALITRIRALASDRDAWLFNAKLLQKQCDAMKSDYSPLPGTAVRDAHPPKHAKYVVLRDAWLYTATPCYGMHDPWWIVRIMGAKWEAGDPETILPNDIWWPLNDFLQTYKLLP
jgi:hypothetical protein